MNKFTKTIIAALVFAVAVPSIAVAEEEEEGPIGWTPFAISLASPVQLPWGIGNWDIFGIDLGLFYNDVWHMYGLDVALVAGDVLLRERRKRLLDFLVFRFNGFGFGIRLLFGSYLVGICIFAVLIRPCFT